jgi:hypothetical protein
VRQQHILGLLVLSAVLSLSLLQCVTGEVNTYNPGTDCPDDCPDGMVCVGQTCEDPAAGCEDVTCGPGEHCWMGECISDDPCDEVRCERGEVCRMGSCVSEDEDSDGDGYIAASDCDDDNPNIHPEAVEGCDGLDQNCNGDIDEGFDADRDGYTVCGSGDPDNADCDDDDGGVHPGAEEQCDGVDDDCDGATDEDLGTEPCSSVCGEGVEECIDGAWVCSAPETCECFPPGDTDEQGCGRCGTQQRTCTSEYTWGGWSGCTGEGECARGDVQREGCERCGTRTRTCGDDCRWGGWSGCTGQGECSPGETNGDGCDRCLYHRCTDACHWGACELRPGSTCEWREGTHYRCCGASHWQFCLPSCVWSTDCASCSGCC